jgi:NADH-quinone oxidoreductase subunit E
MASEELQARLREIVARYPSARSAMLPCLHLAQEEHGYITPEGIQAVAEALGVKPDEVESVVTFYSMYTQEPKGRYTIKVCTSISCYLRGCDDVMAHLEQRLGIRKGETTSDGRFTLESAECLAACGMAPAIQVNGRFVENATTESASALVEYLSGGGDPEAITSPWQPISEGRGMATVSAIGAVGATSEPSASATSATSPESPAAPATDAKAQQNGAHER